MVSFIEGLNMAVELLKTEKKTEQNSTMTVEFTITTVDKTWCQ